MQKMLTRLFGNNKKQNDDKPAAIQTSPLSEAQLSEPIIESTKFRPSQLLIGSGQSIGMQRDHNEDSLYTISSVLADGSHDLALGICIIADGMGGHKNGEIASGVAVRTVASVLQKKIYSHFLNIQQEPFNESIQEIIENAIKEAHRSVIRQAPGGGTTFTCALIIGEQVTIGHIGDTRAYFVYPDGSLFQVTKDHSLVQRMVELGEITKEDASIHPQRNVLLKALGQTENIYPDIQTHPLPRGGHLLLCSDGLWGALPEPELLKIIQNSNNPVEACNNLVEVANANGGPDNISVILVKCYG